MWTLTERGREEIGLSGLVLLDVRPLATGEDNPSWGVGVFLDCAGKE